MRSASSSTVSPSRTPRVADDPADDQVGGLVLGLVRCTPIGVAGELRRRGQRSRPADLAHRPRGQVGGGVDDEPDVARRPRRGLGAGGMTSSRTAQVLDLRQRLGDLVGVRRRQSQRAVGGVLVAQREGDLLATRRVRSSQRWPRPWPAAAAGRALHRARRMSRDAGLARRPDSAPRPPRGSDPRLGAQQSARGRRTQARSSDRRARPRVEQAASARLSGVVSATVGSGSSISSSSRTIGPDRPPAGPGQPGRPPTVTVVVNPKGDDQRGVVEPTVQGGTEARPPACVWRARRRLRRRSRRHGRRGPGRGRRPRRIRPAPRGRRSSPRPGARAGRSRRRRAAASGHRPTPSRAAMATRPSTTPRTSATAVAVLAERPEVAGGQSQRATTATRRHQSAAAAYDEIGHPGLALLARRRTRLRSGRCVAHCFPLQTSRSRRRGHRA